MRWLIGLLIVVLIALHQDNWLWHDKTLIFGFLPSGLAYHALYSAVASLAMWALVLTCWPRHLEDVPEAPPEAAP